MNLFQKYGIKEVADVVFYSINPVGDEVIYTPVLFLDTLKVSTLEKSGEKVFAEGGYGNKKLIGWNYGKEITLNLEDALFTPASMSLIWGGQLNARLSEKTSAIAKANIANKYGELKYSTKAYQSPSLTEAEVDFLISAERGYEESMGVAEFDDSTLEYTYDDESALGKVANKIEEYITTAFIAAFSDDGLGSDKINFNATTTNPVAKVNSKDLFFHIDRARELFLLTKISKDGSYVENFQKDNPIYGPCNIKYLISGSEDYVPNATVTIGYKNIAGAIYEVSGVTPAVTGPPPTVNTFHIDIDLLQLYQNVANDITINTISTKEVTEADRVEFLRTYFNRTLVNTNDENSRLAVKQATLLAAQKFIQSLPDIGYMQTTQEEMEVVDRMERCVVTSKNGQIISTEQQLNNLFRYYRDDKSSSYTIYYDPKTMQPLFRIQDNQIMGIGGTGTQNPDNADLFYLKTGTVYYKWTRTVRPKNSEADDSCLGRQFVINAETFPENYRIVGETYIRNQKTGKDQRYQFTIFKANISSDTSITLEAEGDPTTFSMSVDVLVPPNDVMMELKEYDIENDTIEGGTRILPQKSTYTYTPAYVKAYDKRVEVENGEIY